MKPTLETNKKYRENNKEAAYCHNIVNREIRKGKLIKQICENCGENNTQAHHDDYSKPLKIRWLCSKCHSNYHKNKRQNKEYVKKGRYKKSKLLNKACELKLNGYHYPEIAK
jgi:hypothetical protein